MLTSSIESILVVSGVITAGGGLAALLFPVLFLRFGFGVENPTSSTLLFVRHWGVLILAIAALIVYSASSPEIRTPVLVAGAIEKFAIGFFAFFGRVKRTPGMTAIAVVDGLFATLYVLYLAGL
jgi:hypothetical protein